MKVISFVFLIYNDGFVIVVLDSVLARRAPVALTLVPFSSLTHDDKHGPHFRLSRQPGAHFCVI